MYNCKVIFKDKPCMKNKDVSTFNDGHFICMSDEQLIKYYYILEKEFKLRFQIMNENDNYNTSYDFCAVMIKKYKVLKEMRARQLLHCDIIQPQ